MRTLHMRGIKKILHLSASTTLSLVWLVSAGFCGMVDEAQTLLNRLSYNAGVADGIYGQKTHRALENFYFDLGFKYDGVLNVAELSDLKNAVSGKNITAYSGETASYVPMELKTNHIVPNKLREIKVFPNWKPVKNYDLLVAEEAFQLAQDDGINISLIKREFGEDQCISNLTKADYPGRGEYRNTGRSHSNWYTKCTAWVLVQAKMGNKQIMQDILLAWSDNNISLKGTGGSGNWTTKGYQIPSTMGVFAQYYGLHYRSFNYSDKQRTRVDAHLKKEMMRHRFGHIGAAPPDATKCHVDVPEEEMIKSHLQYTATHNDCGSIRYKVAAGEIILGFALNDQQLLDKGHDDLYVAFAQFDSDGIGIVHAAKGANVVNYSLEYAAYMSIFVELYKSVDYDFLEHTLPHGAKVWQTLVNAYKLKGDHTFYAKYAGAGNRYSLISELTRAEYLETSFAHKVYDWSGGDKQFIKRHMEFVDRYMPESDVRDVDLMLYSGARNHSGGNYGVLADIMHFANK